ncbi:TadE/TadG family type IV pilus assembly protein [Yoonia sediminilitoris]|uniref:Putative Flp pilus-assembly TadE/G-like protein n=1 Tax=Yoonia sediminilitoris TaxID=1286148 RepID=A0A2T6KQE4_9RHOB|nr:Tad domain-containing protein [Yoonia sediminilitoris]PUB18781.1 putative Flp pilus-assembly TadE/G-like protein [Yoonia sediminilitoris]RCW98949.1 putative Flp pilus-assembly TadE/G-like protein [Yoonia sediminilitoris]
MLKRNSAATGVRSEFNDRRAALLRQFGREEDGSIIVMTILLLVIGGMAVDFMRFESRRAFLQSVADRAVLAAADLDQPLDQKAVVTVYFQKAGFDGAIQGQPIIDDNNGNVLVPVNSSLDIDTFYLRFIGIDQLTAPASSEAREGVGQVAVSLVLDISGSMDQIVSDATLPTPSARSCPAPVGSGYHNATNLARVSRIKLLREAACGFVYDPIPSETAGQVTLLLVAYTSQVALSGEFCDALRTTDPLVGIGGTAAEIPETEEEITVALSAATLWRNPSRCVEFEDSDYEGGRAPRTKGQTDDEEEFGTTLYATKTYTQTRSFQYNVGGL